MSIELKRGAAFRVKQRLDVVAELNAPIESGKSGLVPWFAIQADVLPGETGASHGDLRFNRVNVPPPWGIGVGALVARDEFIRDKVRQACQSLKVHRAGVFQPVCWSSLLPAPDRNKNEGNQKYSGVN